MDNMRKIVKLTILILAAATLLNAQETYQKPPKDILDILNAPPIPSTSISPARDKIAILEPLRYPPISELAEPMLRIAGLRINPNTTAQHRQQYFVSLKLKNIADGSERQIKLRQGAKIISPQWSPDGKYLAIGDLTPTGVDLWIIDTVSAEARQIKNVKVNTAFGGFSWEDGRTIAAQLVPSARGAAPQYQNVTPIGPAIQETSGRTGAVQTFQDLLKNPNDEKLFDYYCTSQLAMIDVKGKVKLIGKPGIYDSAEVSPDGKYVSVARIERPYSYQFPYNRFPRINEIWDTEGNVKAVIAKQPLQNNLPIQGVPVGPRNIAWIPTENSTLIWTEALDGGDPKNKVKPRDRMMTLSAPFDVPAKELLKVENRLMGRQFGERDGLMMFTDYDRDKQRRRTFVTSYKDPSQINMIADLNVNDRYNDIGQPVTKLNANGSSVIRMIGSDIFFTGQGASAEGDRPFLRKMDLNTKKTTEIFRSSKDEYETFSAFLNDDGSQFITRKESPSEPPNLYLRQVCPPEKICTTMAYRPLTEFKDPSPQLRGITKKLVRYKRADGVDLSFTLYLPPGYKEGTRLPTVVWAYPLEFTDASTAGQVSGSTSRFTQIGGYSHLFFLLQGYAVLDDTTMPIVGDPLTVNDTFIKQIVDSAKAAIDKGVELGVVDRDRVGVGGHSYGAFMTANLLAHSDLFRAGIARSGAYNRTLTPFGFQSERRNFWEAKELYENVSPFFFADKINEPLLMIHGEADNNQGTFPIQSERLFAAISGLGGTSRLVMLPLEAHGYSAKESTEHTLYEMVNWFDKYVKNAPPRSAK